MKTAIPIIVNSAGGTALRLSDRLVPTIEDAFRTAGMTAHVQLVKGSHIADAVTEMAGEPIVAVGGGDGTIGSAAGAIVDADGQTTLAILPLGTRNHLALQLGLPADLEAVAKLIAEGAARRIDIGRVNGRAFVNNASIGFYPDMVENREAVRRYGLPKWLANLPAAWRVLGQARHHRLRLLLDGSEQRVRTPMLFVGNNRYQLALGQMGKRESLEDGRLSIYAVQGGTRLWLASMAARMMVGRADPRRDFAAIADVETFAVRAHQKAVRIALDGEVVRLLSPLRFETQPKALTVIAPSQQ